MLRCRVIGNVKNALHGTHHAVSGRHLPRYLAEFCYRFNRRFQLHTMVDRLSRRQTITVTQKYLSGIRGRNEMVKNVTVIS
jgi:hypothetical protein